MRFLHKQTSNSLPGSRQLCLQTEKKHLYASSQLKKNLTKNIDGTGGSQTNRHRASRTVWPKAGDSNARLVGHRLVAQGANLVTAGFTVVVSGRTRVQPFVATGLTALAREPGAGLPADGQVGCTREETSAAILAFGRLKSRKRVRGVQVASAPTRQGRDNTSQRNLTNDNLPGWPLCPCCRR